MNTTTIREVWCALFEYVRLSHRLSAEGVVMTMSAKLHLALSVIAVIALAVGANVDNTVVRYHQPFVRNCLNCLQSNGIEFRSIRFLGLPRCRLSQRNKHVWIVLEKNSILCRFG
jgi:hypothetical protein